MHPLILLTFSRQLRKLGYDGEALAGRGVVQAPEQRGEHRQRLRADLAVGPCLSPGGASGRATIITRTLALRSSGTRRPGPKTFSRGPMPRCDLERAVVRFALCGLGCPFLPCLALASAAAKVSAAAWAASFACASWCPFF